MVSNRNVLDKDNTRVTALPILNENRKTMIFKVLGSVIYWIMDNYLCVDYLCLQQAKIYFAHKIFENKIFNNIQIDISEPLMNIMSCHGFVNDNNSTVILSWHRNIFPITYQRVFWFLKTIQVPWEMCLYALNRKLIHKT